MTSTKNICVFGDSIAHGQWTRNGGWVDRLARDLMRRTIDSGFEQYYFLYNLSIPGDTTADVAVRFGSECDAREPHIIIFAIGINDASCRGSRGAARVGGYEFKKNTVALIRDARERARSVMWIGLTRVDEARTLPFEDMYFSNPRIASYDTLVKEICARERIGFVDVADVCGPGDLGDGLHPDDAGHEKLYRAVASSLASYL